MSTLGVLIIILVVLIGLSVVGRITRSVDDQKGLNSRECLRCHYKGPMRTWLGNYFFAQFLAIVLFCLFLVPGLLFVCCVSGKRKCPNCGSLGKNMPIQERHALQEEKPLLQEVLRRCPFCAEMIKDQAIKCRFCGSELPKSLGPASHIK